MLGVERPTGTVTFLFTDIEGSTKLWETHPSQMRTALARHDALMRQAFDRAGGYVFKTMGDAFCVAFAMAPDALSAATAAQVSLYSEPWPTETPIKVRMAMHTGAVESRDDDYFGHPLSRVARLLAVGHGDQVLMSQTTHELVRDLLPDGTDMRPMGQHRLKDLGRPESIYQLLHPTLPSEFPALRSLDNPELKHNLPQQITSFVGREKQIEDVLALLGKTRLLTLTGAGGGGKTRLSLQVAADRLNDSDDGVWLVELAPLSDPELVPQTVANVLGLKEEAGRSLVQTLVEYLRHKRLLLILDSCEHLLDASARIADTLIRHCPEVQILASSREGLGIAGELTYRVPTLSSPDPKRDKTAESLSQFEAVRLFIERAQFHRPSFAVDNSNAPALASICFRLDGIPLAIELAAARVRSLSVEEIDHKLDYRFGLLTGGSRTALPRQQTLRSLIDWSYDLLNEAEKLLFRRLSIFAGGWTLAAAEGVCSGEGVEESRVLDLLTSLTDKSLVVADQRDGHSRYRYLESVRQYAKDRLDEIGRPGEKPGPIGNYAIVDLDRQSPNWLICQRHGAYFLGLAGEVEVQLTRDQVSAFTRFAEDHDNFRAAIEWNLRSGDAQDALALASALGRFWDTQGHLSEGRSWLGQTLEVNGEAPSRLRAAALRWLGALTCNQAEYQLSTEYLDACLGLYLELGDRLNVAAALVHLGCLALEQGHHKKAKGLFEESLEISRSLNDLEGQAICLGNLGAIETAHGNNDDGYELLSQAVVILRGSSNKQDGATALNNLGNAAYSRKEFDKALSLYHEALGIYERLSDLKGIAVTKGNLGTVAFGQGSLEQARDYHQQSLTITRDLSDQRGIATALTNLGDVAFAMGDQEAADRLHEEALAVVKTLGDKSEVATVLNSLGTTAYACGDSRLALKRYIESLNVLAEIGDTNRLTAGLAEIAHALLMDHNHRLSAQILGAVSGFAGEDSAGLSPSEMRNLEAVASCAIDVLGADEFSAAYNEGEHFSVETVLAVLESAVSRAL